MARKFRNNATSTLAGALATDTTSIQVATGHGDRFPAVSAPDYFMLYLEKATGKEIVKVTARAPGSDNMTVVRAQEGTTALPFAIGDIVSLRLTSEALDAFENTVNAFESLANAFTGHQGATTNAHPASAISYTPSSGITQTTVQTAIADLVLGATTINVGPSHPYTTIQAAIDSLNGKVLRGGVTIQLDAGEYTQNKIDIKNQPWGSQITLRGDTSNPDNCVIRFTPDANGKSYGITVDNSFVNITGVKIVGEITTSNFTNCGIQAINNAVVVCGAGTVRIEECYIGLEAAYNSVIYAPSVVIAGGITGAHADHNGYIRADSAQITCVSANDIIIGSITYTPTGLSGVRGGIVYSSSPTISTARWGIYSTYPGTVIDVTPTFSNCTNNYYQSGVANSTMQALASLGTTTGLVEQTGSTTFTKRAIGTASGNVPVIGTESATTTLAGLVRKATLTEATNGTGTGVVASADLPNAVATLAGSSNGEFRSAQVFTSSGTWTKPANLKRIKVTVVGGGGGSGGGKGGGGGGAAIKYIEAGSLGTTVSVTIGAGGSPNNSGGTSSFGTHCSATGGSAGGFSSGGFGGLGSGGNINIRGDSGSSFGGGSLLGGGNHVDDPLAGAYGAGGGGGGASGAAGIVIVEEFF